MVNDPAVVTRPIWLPPLLNSVNHSAASGPAVIHPGLPAKGTPYSVTDPVVVMRPILLAFPSVNHKAPSGPEVIPLVWVPGVGSGNWLISKVVVIRPMLPVDPSVNHKAPSGPGVIAYW